jgi:hypothetical protein
VGFQELAMPESDLWKALTKVPLMLKDAAVLLRAQRSKVGYEAAAVLAFKEKGQMKNKAENKQELTVKSIVQVIAGNTHQTQTTHTGHCFSDY